MTMILLKIHNRDNIMPLPFYLAIKLMFNQYLLRPKILKALKCKPLGNCTCVVLLPLILMPQCHGT